MWALKKMIRTGIVFLFSLSMLLLFTGTKPEVKSSQSASIMGHLDQIELINRDYLELLDTLKNFSTNRLVYFEKGLGWQENSVYGFFSGKYSVYFSKTSMGISVLSGGGSVLEKLSLDFSKTTYYGVYEKTGSYKLTVGRKNSQAGSETDYIGWVFPEGQKLRQGTGGLRFLMQNLIVIIWFIIKTANLISVFLHYSRIFFFHPLLHPPLCLSGLHLL